jgi:hypothetical protein
MEKRLNLEFIFVGYQSSNHFSQEYSTIRKFNVSLPTYPLASINWIYIKYELNEDKPLSLKIKQGLSDHEWNVYYKDKLFFPFTCTGREDFMEIFEKNLKQNLD